MATLLPSADCPLAGMRCPDCSGVPPAHTHTHIHTSTHTPSHLLDSPRPHIPGSPAGTPLLEFVSPPSLQPLELVPLWKDREGRLSFWLGAQPEVGLPASLGRKRAKRGPSRQRDTAGALRLGLSSRSSQQTSVGWVDGPCLVGWDLCSAPCEKCRRAAQEPGRI